MTLTKAIEAAREALKIFAGDPFKIADKALAALPDKPMTEDEIRGLILINLAFATTSFSVAQADRLIRALKAANALYVEEK